MIPTEMARLSIAMIVKDEEEMAPDFLAATRGLYDELVVVDTGSTDKTAAIFRDAGAIVVSAPWTRDFSAARNIALEHATCDWILVLDADERVSPEFIAEFRLKITDTSIGALNITMVNPMPHGH